MYRLLIIIFILCLVACTPLKTKKSLEPVPQNCQEAWVYAPDSLILELSSGNQVLLDPAVHDFPLFCTKEEAQTNLNNLIATQKYPAKGWAYYRLAGQFTSLAKVQGGQTILKETASLVDWER